MYNLIDRISGEEIGQISSSDFKVLRDVLVEENDDDTDYYPVPLSADQLRPGTVYADPYGHLLVLVKRLEQTKDAAGVYLLPILSLWAAWPAKRSA